ncbi:MAG TPA: glycosyltransferase family 2 protein [Candidatus Paceibacterota bacterium]|nr:glycosyltransferase family 2 protein [Candidatus Paceibacterota bacterium]
MAYAEGSRADEGVRPAEAPGQAAITLSPAKFAVLFGGILAAYALIAAPQGGVLNWYLTIAWSLYLPFALTGLYRLIRRGNGTLARSAYAGRTDARVIFVIPTVCREDTLPALRRVIDSIIRHAPAALDDWRIDLLIEEDAPAAAALRAHLARRQLKRRVRLLVIPAGYRPLSGARHKARANQYALEARRRSGEDHAGCFVYHLDDDTHVGSDTVRSIAEFVRTKADRYYLAQGVLTFPHELSPSLFCRLADSIRPGDDITRCGFFTGELGLPLGGLHGEHLLVRADIEDAIGWDADTLVEDARFALLFACRYPGRSCTLASFSYGASPACIRDLVCQRRRWAAGLFGLVLKGDGIALRARIPLAWMMLCWVMGPFQSVAVALMLAWMFGNGSTSPVAWWWIVPWALNLAYSLFQYLEGLKVNLLVSARRGAYLPLALLLVPLSCCFAFVEGYAALAGLVRFLAREHAFEVIAKNR